MSNLMLSWFSFLCRSPIYCFGNIYRFCFLSPWSSEISLWCVFRLDTSPGNWCVLFIWNFFVFPQLWVFYFSCLLDQLSLQFSLLYFNSYLLCFLGHEFWFLSLATFCYAFFPQMFVDFWLVLILVFENPCLPPDDVSFSHSLHT